MTRHAMRALCVFLAAVFLAVVWGSASAFAQDRDRPVDRPTDRPGLQRGPDQAPASLREWLEALPPELRRSAISRLRNMPEPRRRAFFRRWSRMSDVQRLEFQTRLEHQGQRRLDDLASDLARGDRKGVREHYRRMTPAERRHFRAQMNKWRDMKPRERDAMRRRLNVFRGLSDTEQKALVERSFPGASPPERARKLEQLRAAARAQRPRAPGHR